MNNITSENYVKHVLVTESNDFDAIRSRLSTQKALKFLLDNLIVLTMSAEDVTTAKKVIFYGSTKVSIPENGLVTTANAENEQLVVSPDVPEVTASRLKEEDVIRLTHSILGKVTEAAELAQILLDYVLGNTPIDWIHVSEEEGDSQWYGGINIDLICKHTGKTFNSILADNIAKLKARYGEKFSGLAAENRDLVAERQVLELDDVEKALDNV